MACLSESSELLMRPSFLDLGFQRWRICEVLHRRGKLLHDRWNFRKMTFFDTLALPDSTRGNTRHRALISRDGVTSLLTLNMSTGANERPQNHPVGTFQRCF